MQLAPAPPRPPGSKGEFVETNEGRFFVPAIDPFAPPADHTPAPLVPAEGQTTILPGRGAVLA